MDFDFLIEVFMTNKFAGKPPLEDDTIGKEQIAEAVSILVNPKGHDTKKIEECKAILLAAIRAFGKLKLGRMKLIDILMKLGIEPCDAIKTELGKLVPDKIPLRTLESAWKIITENERLLNAYTARYTSEAGGVTFEERKRMLMLYMFEAALFWNSEISRFGTYFKEYVKKSWREIGNAALIADKYENTDLLYGVRKKTEKGDRALRERGLKDISGWIADGGTASNDPAELVENAQTIKNLKDGTAAFFGSLTPREEKAFRMRFGIGVGPDHPLEFIGQDFFVTRERIRAIEECALKELNRRGIKYPQAKRRMRTFLE